jgi:hypothetical protein
LTIIMPIKITDASIREKKVPLMLANRLNQA